MTTATYDDGLCRTDLLVLLAESVIELQLQSSALPFSLPYADVVQLALDLVGFACLERGSSPPGSVAELMSWCRLKEVGSWPIPLPGDLVRPEVRLIHQELCFPTMTCVELASYAAGGGVRRLARRTFEEAVAGRSPQIVEACRDLLLGRVLTDEDMQWTMLGDARQAMAWKLVGGLYEAPPKSYVVDRTVSVCGSCGMLAVPSPNGALWCEVEGCPRTGGAAHHEASRVRVLSYPLRVSFSLAGRTELAVRSLLRERGFTLDPVPDRLGAFHLAGSGRSWTLRVHDRAEPVLHALAVTGEYGGLVGDELIVMPKRAFTRQPGYAETFAAALPLGVDVPLVPDDLVIQVLDGSRGRHERSFDA